MKSTKRQVVLLALTLAIAVAALAIPATGNAFIQCRNWAPCDLSTGVNGFCYEHGPADCKCFDWDDTDYHEDDPGCFGPPV